jgi:hypothetical protein
MGPDGPGDLPDEQIDQAEEDDPEECQDEIGHQITAKR